MVQAFSRLQKSSRCAILALFLLSGFLRLLFRLSFGLGFGLSFCFGLGLLGRRFGLLFGSRLLGRFSRRLGGNFGRRRRCYGLFLGDEDFFFLGLHDLFTAGQLVFLVQP